MKLYKHIYNSSLDEKITLIARLRKDICGRFFFETSENGKEFELNVNMPMFLTEDEAYKWLEQRADWKEIRA